MEDFEKMQIEFAKLQDWKQVCKASHLAHRYCCWWYVGQALHGLHDEMIEYDSNCFSILFNRINYSEKLNKHIETRWMWEDWGE